jgi:hypothetical protein
MLRSYPSHSLYVLNEPPDFSAACSRLGRGRPQVEVELLVAQRGLTARLLLIAAFCGGHSRRTKQERGRQTWRKEGKREK